MPETRSALIVATYEYEDPNLTRLRAPERDAEALSGVLGDADIGGFDVHTVVNQPAHVVNVEVANFFSHRRPDDLLLVHFSCHGVKDDSGELYFAATDTRLDLLEATAVGSAFVNKVMDRSRSMRVVLLLDCCYAGAFARGMTSRGGPGLDLSERLLGHGRAVITASTAMQFAFEGQELTNGNPDDTQPSVFTRALVEGLRTGEADRDLDGMVSLDDLYEYVYDEVTTHTPHQTPAKWAFGLEGDLLVAKRGAPVHVPSELPLEITGSVESSVPWEREAVIPELERILTGRHPGRALAARLALERLVHDDSRKVAGRAQAALAAVAVQESPPPEAPTPVVVPAPAEPPVQAPPTSEPPADQRHTDDPPSKRFGRATALAGVCALLLAGVVTWLLTTGGPGSGTGGDAGHATGQGPSASKTFGNVVVLSTTTGGTKLFAVDAVTGKPAHLASTIAGTKPAISPDRRWLVYLATGQSAGQSGGQPFLLGADGRSAPLVKSADRKACPMAGRPAWSPDSDLLAVPCIAQDGVGRTLYVVDRRTGTLKHDVWSSRYIRGGVAWAGDDRIVYPMLDPRTHVTSLWSVGTGDHGKGQQITDPKRGADLWPSWSDQSGELLFRRSDGMTATGDMWASDEDGGNAVNQTAHSRFAGHVLAPVWSPDGTGAALVVVRDNGSTELWRGTSPDKARRLVRDAGTLGPPAW